jgi:hypothetical protein
VIGPTSGSPPPWYRRSVYGTVSLPQAGGQVLGKVLNRSESGVRFSRSRTPWRPADLTCDSYFWVGSRHHSPVLDRAAFDLRWRRSPAMRSTSMDRNRAQLCLESSVNEIVVSCDRRDHRRKSSANMMPTSPQKGFLQCSGCRSPMRLLSTLPALGRFSAQQIYVCAPCHRVQAVEHAVVASSMLNEGMAT